MGRVEFPTPDNPGQAPVWENYITAQLAGASLGIIPLNTVALGVSVDRYEVTIHCQLRTLTQEDQEDLDDIVAELQVLVGDEVHVRCVHEIRTDAVLYPAHGIRWTYAAPDRVSL